MSALRAVVIGTGFAGEGHTLALRHAGVEVVALCGRDPDVAGTRAAQLGVPHASTDWRATLAELHPEIVALAVPAFLRREVVEVAAAQKIHVYCDKPLATSAAEARELVRLVEDAGVCHAFAATRTYEPSAVWLGELVRDGRIGVVQEAVFTLDTHLAPLLPWSWALVLAQGGGLLNNHFPHLLAILERVLSGPVVRATGQAQAAITTAPFLPDIHDFRDWSARADRIAPELLAATDWRPCDADTAYAALLRFATPTGPVPVTVVSSAAVAESCLRLRGTDGTLVAHGRQAFQVGLKVGDDETSLPVPERLREALPQVDGNCGDRWAALAHDFVAAIRGEPHAPFLTFHDGWRYQEAIEAVRSGTVWSAATTARSTG